MKARIVIAALILLALAGGLRMAGDVSYWQRYLQALGGPGASVAASLAKPRVLVAGAPQEPVRASAAAELLSPEALADAQSAAATMNARALLVHRHGHRLFEHFDARTTDDTLVAGGELAAAPFALALGALVESRRVDAAVAIEAVRQATAQPDGWRNPWSEAARQRFTLREAPPLLLQDAEGDAAGTISRRIWQPLHAGDAWLWGSGDAALRVDCCMVARLGDWMRVADVLLGQGRLRGERIVSADWVRRLLAADDTGRLHPAWLAQQRDWNGDEPPAARDMSWFDLGDDLRLWVSPRRGLAVLVWAGDATATDTALVNTIVRGLLDQAPAISGGQLHELVPGH